MRIKIALLLNFITRAGIYAVPVPLMGSTKIVQKQPQKFLTVRSFHDFEAENFQNETEGGGGAIIPQEFSNEWLNNLAKFRNKLWPSARIPFEIDTVFIVN